MFPRIPGSLPLPRFTLVLAPKLKTNIICHSHFSFSPYKHQQVSPSIIIINHPPIILNNNRSALTNQLQWQLSAVSYPIFVLASGSQPVWPWSKHGDPMCIRVCSMLCERVFMSFWVGHILLSGVIWHALYFWRLSVPAQRFVTRIDLFLFPQTSHR